MCYDQRLRDEDELAIEVEGDADIAELADEVYRTGRSKLLCRDGQPLARVVPERTKNWRPTPEQIARFKSAAGSWADVDTDAMLEWIYERRSMPPKPPVELRATWLTPTASRTSSRLRYLSASGRYTS